jgi:hypothetical protein
MFCFHAATLQAKHDFFFRGSFFRAQTMAVSFMRRLSAGRAKRVQAGEV